MEIMGFEILKKSNKKNQPSKRTFRNAIIDNDDINISLPQIGNDGIAGQLALRNIPNIGYTNDVTKIQLYRKMAQTSVHINLAITELKNEAFVFNDITNKAFNINFYNEDCIQKTLQEKIAEEVNTLYKTIDFKSNATEWFSDWYVDGRFNLHVLIDKDNPKKGVLGVIQLDPINTRKVKILPRADNKGSIDLNDVKEVVVYKNNFNTFNLEQTLYLDTDAGLVDDVILSKDTVISVNSGLRDKNTNKTISHLDKAIIPYNNLKMLEESMVIFRLVRAPMRRAFYIDVSNLQPKKGELYIKRLKDSFKKNVTFDSNTGTIKSDRHIHSILEDYYLPRQGTRHTEIQTLDGQTNQDILEEVEYAREQLWLGLNVPKSRFKEESSTLFSRPTEIQRDEYRFNLFVNKCRHQFMKFFDELLRIQLLLKGIIKDYEWENIKGSYYYTYAEDNLFVEYKNMEKLTSQLDVLERIDTHIGDYYSREWVKKHVLKQNEEDIKNMQQQMESEKDDNDNEDDDYGI